MDRYTALTVFREVAARHSFAAAARHLGLTPAAASKNIAELEADVGARLFHRTTRRLSLTAEGELYLDHVQRGLETLDDGVRALQHETQTASGLLRVSAPLTVTMRLLSASIPAFLAQHPALQLELDLTDWRVDLVRDGYDLALRGGQLADSSLVAHRVCTMPYALCASPEYLRRRGEPQQPADLLGHECIRFTPAHADKWHFSRAGREVAVPVQARYSVSSSLPIIDAVCAGFGISLMPAGYITEELASGRLQALLPEWQTPPLDLYAVVPSRRLMAPKVRVFIQFLEQVLQSAKV